MTRDRRVSIGAHVSTSGGLWKAAERAKAIGCDALQVFYGAPVAWAQPAYDDEQVARFRMRVAELGLGPVFVHAMYLINLASADGAMRRKSVAALTATLRFGGRIGAAGVILHPGSHQGRGFETVLPLVARSLADSWASSGGSCPIVLECSAGGGGSVGRDFGELAALIGAAGASASPGLGICLDIAHLHGAGYDVVTTTGIGATFSDFGSTVGWDRLRVIHANDSNVGRGARADRHENIGKGKVGVAGFRRMLSIPRLRAVPWILEVPGSGEGPDRQNVTRLRGLARNAK